MKVHWKTKRLFEKNRRKLSPEDTFRQESKIMENYLVARIEAAKAKSTSKEDEAYRISKAKYSCNSALKSQLDALLNKDPDNRYLLGESAKLERQLKKYKTDFRKKVPASHKKWEKAQGFNDKRVVQNKLAQMKKKNASYNEEDAKLYMKYMYVSNQGKEYADSMQKAGKGVYKADGGDADRFFRSMTYVSYLDQNGKPLTEKDAKKEQFNKKWIDLCAEDSKNKLEETKKNNASADEIRDLTDEAEKKEYERQQMIYKRLKDFEEFPLPTPDELTSKGILKIFEENPSGIYENIHVALCVDNLQKKEPYLKTYMEEHLLTDQKIKAWGQLSFLMTNTLREEHLININLSGINADSEKEDYDASDYIASYIAEYEKYQSDFQKEKKKEDDYKAALKKGEQAEKSRSVLDEEKQEQTANIFRIKEERKKCAERVRKKSIEELRKVNPSITEEGYALYEKALDVNSVMHDPELLSDVEIAKKVYKDGTHVTLSRMFAPVLKEIKYDKRFEPADEQSKSNFEWNKKWIKSFIDKDVETQDQMINQVIPTMYDDLKIKLPEPDELEEYIDNAVKEHTDEFIETMAKVLGLSNLKAYSETMKKILDNNQVFSAMSDAYAALGNVMSFHTQHKYGVHIIYGGQEAQAIPAKEQKLAEVTYNAMKDEYLAALKKYHDVVNSQKNK